MVAAAVLNALAPTILKQIVDVISRSGGPGDPVALVLLPTAYLLTLAAARVATELRGLLFSQAERRVHRRLGQRAFTHVMSLPLGFHLDRRTGGIGQALTNGLQGLHLILYHLIATIFPVVVELLTIAGILSSLGQHRVLGILAAAVVAYTYAFWRGVSRIMDPARAASTASIDANAVMTDSIMNYETVKYCAAEPAVQDRYDRAARKVEAGWNRFHRVKAETGLGVAAVFALSMGAVVADSALQVTHGAMTLGEFVLINAYVLHLVRPIEAIGLAAQDVSKGLGFLEGMLRILREAPEPHDGRPDVEGGVGALVFEDVTFGYGPGRPVVRKVSFSVPGGRTLAVVGASGAGKSSLIRLLVRLCEPDEGRILIDGQPITSLSPTSLRRTIAVVPQDTALFNETIAYNIAFGRKDSTAQEIVEAARLAGLHDFILSLPEGYDTVIGERGVKLSGGERQRLSIARAIIRRPRVFVFDEATSSLDTRTEREILENIRTVTRGATVLLIAHRLSTITHADEIVVLDDGAVVERGKHDWLLRQHGPYARLWRAQDIPGATRTSSVA